MIIFNDIITAYHKEKYTAEDGSTQERRAEMPFIDKIPCQISYNSNDKGTPAGRDRRPQSRAMKVFVWFEGVPKGEMFKRGDYVIFERLNEYDEPVTHHEGTIGEPQVYTRGIPHVQLSLEAEG